MTAPTSASQPAELPLEALVALYGIEAGLIQQKAAHILTIRSVALATVTGILAAIVLRPEPSAQLLGLILLPFYVLDFVYDAYLLPIVRRETQLRAAIATALSARGCEESLATAYGLTVDHRVTPPAWSPFRRTALEPVRVLFYATLVLAPFIVFGVLPHL